MENITTNRAPRRLQDTTAPAEVREATWQPPAGSAARLVTDEIRQVTDEAEALRAAFAPFAERVRAVQRNFADLATGIGDDGEDLRQATGYEGLMDVCWKLLDHASAAADCEPPGTVDPAPAPTAYRAALAAAPAWLNLPAVVDEAVVQEVNEAADQVEALVAAVTAASKRAHLALRALGDGPELPDDVFVLVLELTGSERSLRALQQISDDAGAVTGSVGDASWADELGGADGTRD